MDKKAQESIEPNYVQIYKDLITAKFPHLLSEYEELLKKENLSHFEVKSLNEKLFNKKTTDNFKLRQKYVAYDEKTIIQILRYQKEHKLNNTQLAQHFKLSRNSVAKWLKLFRDKI